jgi:uracil-DNA glycosylase
MTFDPAWKAVLADEFKKAYFIELAAFLREERKQGVVYPPADQLFTAFGAASYDRVKVVILGQDPYHQAGQAHGLSFSVPRGVPLPPSLKNVYKELEQDMGCRKVRHGYLLNWAERGVLLLNSVLTVRAGQPGSHQGRGWETFTDEVIRKLSGRERPVVFVLWGRYAREKIRFIDTDRHPVVSSPHPSPFSAASGFFGSKPFSLTNGYLEALDQEPIDWQLPE